MGKMVTSRVFKAPRPTTRVSNINLTPETKEKLNISDYLLHLKTSEWNDVTKIVIDCFKWKKTKVFTCRGLYEEHISAFKSLSDSHDYTECTAPFKNYLTKLLKYYKQDIVWKEFQGIFNKEHRKGRLEDAREEAEEEVEIASKKMESKIARGIGESSDPQRGNR
jgi:hypothetical protein